MTVSAAQASAFYRWLPGLAEDGLKIGLNWSGPRATGYDIEPETVMWRLDQLGLTRTDPLRTASTDEA